MDLNYMRMDYIPFTFAKLKIFIPLNLAKNIFQCFYLKINQHFRVILGKINNQFGLQGFIFIVLAVYPFSARVEIKITIVKARN